MLDWEIQLTLAKLNQVLNLNKNDFKSFTDKIYKISVKTPISFFYLVDEARKLACKGLTTEQILEELNMTQEQKTIQTLCNLFSDNEKTRKTAQKKISKILEPTILAALEKLGTATKKVK